MVRSASRSSFLFEHDLFGKPDSTFPDHALVTRRRARRRRRSGRLRAALLSQRGEILLTGFERIHFRSDRAFRIHREPDRPDDDADDPRDILSDLGVILLSELFGLDVACLDLGADHRAIALRVLWLYDRYGMRV